MEGHDYHAKNREAGKKIRANAETMLKANVSGADPGGNGYGVLRYSGGSTVEEIHWAKGATMRGLVVIRAVTMLVD